VKLPQWGTFYEGVFGYKTRLGIFPLFFWVEIKFYIVNVISVSDGKFHVSPLPIEIVGLCLLS